MKIAGLLFVLVASSIASGAESPTTLGQTFGIYIENDSRRVGGPGSDQAYSSGIKFSYLQAENKVPGWADSILARLNVLESERQKSKSNFGISFGQQIYTPNDTLATGLIKNDRPYVAWSYLAFSAHFKTPSHAHYWELAVGTVGPNAMGEKVQNEFHRIIDSPQVWGWKNQIHNEPTLQISYQQRVKFLELADSEDGKYFDVVPFYGGGFGNVLIGAQAGAMARVGYYIPDDLAPTRPSPTGGDIFVSPKPVTERWDWSFYGFAAIRGYAVAHSILLDGNSFRESHSVKKYPFVGESEIGFAAEISNWNLIWRFVTKSPEFEEKSRFNSFASLNLSYTY